MDLEYDMKFEEMKKYIPFLESMIKRLDSTSSASANPRQAQLDKIRSLRDLLLVKKKRMKMENLLKCEQVLINLYAKVEQRDTLPGIQPASKVMNTKEQTDLNLARHKLKTVAADPDTLPEIARASETEVVCVPGSKEPALFQRRPNKSSVSPPNTSSNEKSPLKSSSKRNYTRVLVSPDRSTKHWSPSNGPDSDKPLFSRRTPPRPSRRYSPSHHKREKKKSSKQESHSRKPKDLNITLKVPEESLDSLNTKDILSRIINCSDGDVDIATLRELRTQILGELKQTGANEDISDLILKSYKNKKRTNKKDDVEEGELSDSESEAIESIYGNLVVVEKDSSKVTSNQNKSSDHDQVPRKIQICLVINSDKEEKAPEPSNKKETEKQKVCDVTDFEMFDDDMCNARAQPASSAKEIELKKRKEAISQNTKKPTSPSKANSQPQEIITVEDVDSGKEEDKSNERGSGVIDMNNFDLQDESNNFKLNEDSQSPPKSDSLPFKANFYKPLIHLAEVTDAVNTDKPQDKSESEPTPTTLNKTANTPVSLDKSNNIPVVFDEPAGKNKVEKELCSKNSEDQLKEGSMSVVKSNDNSNNTSIKDSVEEPKESSASLKLVDNVQEIPLLNEPTIQPATKDGVSEIDILQALKNEILSETIALPCAEVATPALHQPKITKVSNAQELPKKRISIEKYKQKSQKSTTPRKLSLFVTHPSVCMSKEESRKQSLKLTEKEVERFNLISKIALDDSSDEDKNLETIMSPEDMNLAPQSPDVDLKDNESVSPPVIIPVDPVKTTVVSKKADVDMRNISDTTSPTMGPLASTPNNSDSKNINTEHNKPGKAETKWPTPPADPRVRRDKDPLLPTPQTAFPNVISSRSSSMNPSLTPSMTPNITPSRTPTRAPNMTPNGRSFESRPFDNDDVSRKHVYAPMFPTQDNSIPRTPVWEPPEPSPVHKPSWDVPDREKNLSRKWDDRDPRNSFSHRDEGTRSRFGDSYDGSYNRSKNDRYGRDDYSRQDCPQTSSFYGRGDCPATPTPSFGRGDAPATPSHYFGRSEGSMTPSHPFGREAPLTPTHPFGMSDAPLTPSHPFGKTEAPSTPSHAFGRNDVPLTPSHPFGRTDYSYNNPSSKYGKLQDPRFNRNYDNDSNSRGDRYRYNRNDPRTFNSEKSLVRNVDKTYTPDQSYNRETMLRRESSVGRSTPKENERDRLYSRDRNHGPENSRSYAEVGSRRTFQREPSAGRSIPDPRSRASSVGRSCDRGTSKELSVKSHAGRSFTIDVSVNSTFQKFIDSHKTNESSFEARRQRASSVGRALTRESSVGRTLSHYTEKENINKFRRAQSVGRDLSRAQSVGRDLKHSTRTEKSFKDVKAEFESYRNKSNKLKHENTLPPIKTHDYINNRDPRCRRDSYDKQYERTSSWNKSNIKETNTPVKKFNYRDPRQRKEQKKKDRSYNQDNRNRSDSRDRHSYGISSECVIKNTVINSVKNYKIPKIKRAPEEKPIDAAPVKVETKKKEVEPVEKDAKQKSREAQVKTDKKLKSEKKTSADKSVNKDMRDEKTKEAVELSEKRVTRQSGRINEIAQSSQQSEDEEIAFKPRKFKKVICQSDSDENSSEVTETNKERKEKQISPKKTPLVKTKNQSTDLNKINKNEDLNGDRILHDKKQPNEQKKDKELEANPLVKNKNQSTVLNEKNENEDINEDPSLHDKQQPNDPVKHKELEANLDTFEPEEKQDSSFGLDEIENLFPDSIITDPVLDNINALIADLDHDLETPKGDATCNDLFSEISIENMLEKITSSPVKPCKAITERPGADIVKSNLFDSLKQSEASCLSTLSKSVTIADHEITDIHKTETTKSQSVVKNADNIGEQKDLSNILQSEAVDQTDAKNAPEPVVSTSVNEEETPKKDLSLDIEKNVDGRSTPDSTNDAEIATKDNCRETERLPDSTIEKQCEMNSDITSTHDTDEKVCKDSHEAAKETTSQIDSIGSLLSILQDKTKIKELLSMLGDQSSENEKIKKKLEKLSEIVSDDEDTNDGRVEETEKSETLPEEKVEEKVETKDASQDTEQEMISKNQIHVVEQNDKKVDFPTCEEKAQVANKCDGKSEETVIAKELDQPVEQKDFDDEATSELDNDQEPSNSVKKNVKKVTKRFKSGILKRGRGGKKVFDEDKRVTRSEGPVLLMKPGPPKKPSRELKQLHESIKEMFMSDDILNASGIRMCRLAKMVGDKSPHQKDDVLINDSEPVVVLEKVKHVNEKDGNVLEKPPRKKPGPKPKVKPALNSPDENKLEVLKPNQVKYKPGPKSKTRFTHSEKDTDPYNFETDSLNDTKESEKALENSSDSENDSLASSKSFGSTELLVELKKKPKRKRGRGGWQAGVIKPKHKKRKLEVKRAESPSGEPSPEPEQKIVIPDFNCFTDKKYCFSKNVSQYSCRLCESTHNSADIVFHYKKHHPHSEIPLSRMSSETAKEAIEQCEEINFQAISKIPTERYTCRFCYKEFAKKRASLEAFFWHVVSMHTGEYKQLCSECINVTRCPFNLDIPPPPKDIKGQLIGYICGKCNFTQISLENLKMHVIVRHNDEQTEVYTINFAVMTKKTINSLVKRCGVENQPRVTRSSRSNQSLTEASDDRSDVTESEPEMARAETKSNVPAVSERPQTFSFKSKITFETDDNASDISNVANTEGSAVKVEGDDEDDNQQDTQFDESFNDASATNDDENESALVSDKNQGASDDIMDYPHFKIRFTDTGNKEYVCCINGTDNHYKTGLLISMKKHVQLKHSESWDGYCFVCKVIVTPQGQHKFSDCLLHFLDNHLDNFPVLEKVTEPQTKLVEQPAETLKPPERSSTPKSYINVRPLAELLVNTFEKPVETQVPLPVIENVVSLMTPIEATLEPPRPSPTYPVTRKESEPPKEYKYEEAQADIMSKKHRVVLDAMMTPDKLVQVFKCAGRFCSFTSDSAEDALVHASTHQRVGGTNALLCAYCDFDSSGNSIDLVSHVFKNHGRCQYVCGLCFYRAAANQLVGAHIARVHGVLPGQGTVLKAANALPVTDPTEGNLTREIAVPLYICKQTDREETCQFKTVTYAKFRDHLAQRHAAATSFTCYICSSTHSDATALVVHMMTHGLKLYHCTRCVFGADNELELLAHASARHPAKPPQAYLRTIRATGDKGSLKILPLVELKKTVLSIEEVAPNKAKENPVREAERSIELETLIGHINVLDAPSDTPAREPELEQPVAVTEAPTNLMSNIDEAVSNILDNPDLAPMATIIPVPPLIPIINTPIIPTTPPPAEDQNLSKQLTPVLKEEPKDTTPEKTSSEVICLDSDEEDSKQGIINLSDDESAGTSQNNNSSELVQLASSTKKVPPELLYKCSKCSMVCTTFHGFRKHLTSCYNKTSLFSCAHCTHTTDSVDNHLSHYNQEHGISGRYKCAVCHRSEPFLSVMKKHLKIHNITKVVVTSQTGELGDIEYIVSGAQESQAPKPSKPARRKPSTGSSGSVTPTKRRYGPADIDKLPINPILDESLQCEICEFSSKVRLNLVRHLQMHAELQPVPQTAPVNPVPHLENHEKHFDKMVNLASSSIVTRAPEKSHKESTPTVRISPELASRYPKFVPERQRHTCGARGCAYISVDEGMLRRHWDALHAGCSDFHCVHCPPYQHLDKSRPLTASRIVAHLKMHDVELYACSACQYYHYKRQVLEKHVSETHPGGQVLVVREEAAPAPASAPTMDLKPWQCGLCKFRSMLRPEVVDHCSKFHQSKMQFKCAYCPFRTSASENVTKHQASSHPKREQEIFYFYYREGSIPDAADGTPYWQKQRQRMGIDSEPEVKAEISDASTQPLQHAGSILPQIQPSSAPNLNLVKQEVDTDLNPVLGSIEDLCEKFGEFCEPNGLNYKCSLCKAVMEDSKEAMQSHLFEELKYRKWGCRLCSYKAFHQTGLKEHMWTEHRQNQEPIELAVDVNVEAWVSKQLDYQEDLIKQNREKLALQRIQVERTVAPTTSKPVEVSNSAASNVSMQELEKYFGSLGTSSNMMFCCPKCQFKTKDEVTMQDHLESELTKIRWCCSNCPVHFTTYHEAQFHCKSAHSGLAARPVEAARDPALRAAWVHAALRVQRLSARCMPLAGPHLPHHPHPPPDTFQQDANDGEENSLLVIRYEENVPTPEEETLRRKRPASSAPESDDENLIIDELTHKKSDTRKECPHCEFKTKYPKIITAHILRHYNLKPFSCPFCEYNGNKPTVLQHVSTQHSDKPIYANRTPIPSGPPVIYDLSKSVKKFIVPVKKVAEDALVCLVCEKIFTEVDSKAHVHDNIVPKFAKKGEVVVKCCECLLLFPDVVAMQRHNTDLHPTLPINYAYYKLLHDTRDLHVCFHCNQRFSHLIDLKSHHNAVHSTLKLKYSSIPYVPTLTENTYSVKRKADDTMMSLPKRCARKSTTKLPNSQAVAKKSTTKLPFYVDSDTESEEEEEEYSYYGTKPTSWDDLANVTTLMPFCNTILPFSLKKLNEFIKINPKVVVKDIKK